MKSTMMLLQALEGADTRFIEQAKPGKAKKRATFFSVVAAAACVALLLSLFPPSARQNSPSIQSQTDPTAVNTPDPPQETLLAAKMEYADFLRGGGGGRPEYWVYDIADLKISNIQGVTQLPVYHNLWVRNGAGVPPQMTEAEENALIERIRQQLGTLGQDANIEIDDGHNVRVEFQEDIELPEEYRYDYWRNDYDRAQQAAQYLLENYGHLLNMDNPVAYVWDGSRNIYGEQTYRIDFYEGNTTTAQQVINETFCRTSFTFGKGGNLRGLRIQTEDLSKVQGTYEIISSEKAQELLRQGCFLGQQWLVEGAEVEVIRLTYINWEMSQYYIPYYECVVKAPQGENVANDPKIKVYLQYFVPAIDLDAYCTLTGAQITQ